MSSMVMCFFVQTFMTLGLVDVSSRVGLTGPQEAEKYIRDMVCFCPSNEAAMTMVSLVPDRGW